MRIRHAMFGLLAAVLLAAPASAQVVQSIHFGGGLFTPKGLESRVEGDVLVRDYFGEFLPADPSVSDALAFDIKDFRSGSLFGEWNVAFGHNVEVGAGIGVFGRSVPTVYLDLTDLSDREIEQTLRLRVIPMTAVVRFMPFGRTGDVQPYIGAGAGLLQYRYSEIGQFVDPNDLAIYDARYTASGVTPAAVVLGGVKLPLGGDVYGLTLEGRYLMGSGKTGGIEAGFLDEKIDLGGFLFNVGVQVRF